MAFDPANHATTFKVASVPASAKVNMQLAYYSIGPFGPFYEVKSISATTYYRPGQTMSPEVAEQCCRMPNWTVTSVENDLLQTILGLLTGAVTQTVGKALVLPTINVANEVSKL